jgi:RHS repeat-associated protein
LQGTPVFYNASNQQISASAYGTRHLFTGQQWYSELGLYDLRNRFYSPDIGRFLQPDPSGFNGDATNLYRYCRNNPVNATDPFGLWPWLLPQQMPGPTGTQYISGFVSGSWPQVELEISQWYMSGAQTFADKQSPSVPSDPWEFQAISNYGVYTRIMDAGYIGVSMEEAPPGDYNTPSDNPSGDPSLNVAYLTYAYDDSRASSPSDESSSTPTLPPVVVVARWGHAWQGFQPGLWYPSMGGTVPFGQGGSSIIGGMFDFGGTPIGGMFGPLIAPTSPFANPMGSMGLVYGGANGGWNMGAGELINAFTEGGKKPDSL